MEQIPCRKIYHMESGDPNGKIVAQAPAMCYTNEGGLWFKTNTGCNWDGWEAFIAETP